MLNIHRFFSNPDRQPRPYQNRIAILGRPRSLYAHIICPKSPERVATVDMHIDQSWQQRGYLVDEL
jgi:hypothetical protein